MSDSNRKSNVAELAAFGGSPAFDQPRFVGRPNIGDRARLFERIGEALDRRWLTNDGPLAKELEAKLAEFLGVKHCVLVCNATIGLELAIRALDLSGEVIVPSFTFAATAHALEWLGIRPVFCDADPATHMIDPTRVASLVTPATTAILGVHLWGRGCDVDALSRIAQDRKLHLFFDAAHALGASYQSRMFGNFGELEVFSFHATKFFNSFEGGAITTNDDALATKLKLMRNFGFAGYDQVVCVGTNGKMSEISAAMGLTSFDALPTVVETNERNYRGYHSGLETVPGVRLLRYDPREKNNFQYIVLEVDEEQAGLSRDHLVALLWKENIHARKYFTPGCHNMAPYASRDPGAGARLPVTEQLARTVMVLPTGTNVSPADIATICDVLSFAVRHSTEVAARLA